MLRSGGREFAPLGVIAIPLSSSTGGGSDEVRTGASIFLAQALLGLGGWEGEGINCK